MTNFFAGGKKGTALTLQPPVWPDTEHKQSKIREREKSTTLPGGIDFTHNKAHAASLAPTHIVAMPGVTYHR